MARVQLKITPSLAVTLNPGAADWIILEHEIPEESNVGELLADLARDDASFRRMIFDRDTGKIHDELNLVLNQNFLPPPEMTETRLHDGDSIIFLPAYTGG